MYVSMINKFGAVSKHRTQFLIKIINYLSEYKYATQLELSTSIVQF